MVSLRAVVTVWITSSSDWLPEIGVSNGVGVVTGMCLATGLAVGVAVADWDLGVDGGVRVLFL